MSRPVTFKGKCLSDSIWSQLVCTLHFSLLMRYRTIKAHHVWGFTHDLQNTPNFLFFFFFFFYSCTDTYPNTALVDYYQERQCRDCPLPSPKELDREREREIVREGENERESLGKILPYCLDLCYIVYRYQHLNCSEMLVWTVHRLPMDLLLPLTMHVSHKI